MEIGDRIRQRREELGLTQDELAAKLGYKNRSTVNKWEKDGSKLQQKKIVEIAKALGVTPGFLIDGSQKIDTSKVEFKHTGIISAAEIPTKVIPVVGTVACGNPIYAEENIQEYITVNASDNVDFALYAEGDSMNNCKIDDGDTIFIRKQNIVDDGDIALVLVDDTATVKRFYDYPDKVILKPDSRNPRHKDLEYKKNEHNILIQGKVVFIKTFVH